MEFDAWEPFYEEILKDFVFSREKDEAVAVELDKLLGGNRIHGWGSGGLPRGSLRRRADSLGRFRLRTSECEGPRPPHEAAEARLGVHPPGKPPSGRARTMTRSSGTSTSAN